MSIKLKFGAALCAASLFPLAVSTASGYTIQRGVFLRPSTLPEKATYAVRAPADECKLVRRHHPELSRRPCVNRVTVRVAPLSAAEQLRLQREPGTRASVAYAWQYRSASVKTCSIYGCWAWYSQVTAAYHYNGSSVWKDWVDCSKYGGIGYTVTPTWCGYWNNGGGGWGYMNMGDNFTASVFVKGFPISNGYWQRLNVNINGGIWATGG